MARPIMEPWAGEPLDPDTTLEDMRTAIESEDWLTACRMADALDHWLTSGGCLPAGWTARRP